MSVRKMRRTANRRWCEIEVTGREQIVVETEVGRVTIMTGIIDLNGKNVLSVEVLSSPTASFVFNQIVPQMSTLYVRRDAEPRGDR